MRNDAEVLEEVELAGFCKAKPLDDTPVFDVNVGRLTDLGAIFTETGKNNVSW